MAPAFKENGGNITSGLDGDKVVISGISGAFPDALSVKDLEKILYEKIDPLLNGKVRWYDFGNPETATTVGTIPQLESFDAQFFKVNSNHTGSMDPGSRNLLENTYQAIYDAGISADSLAGKNIGVYIGSGSSESETALYYNMNHVNAFSLSGSSKAMFANRTSYWLDVTGPSLAMEAACCGSTVALEQAYRSIRSGEVEAAIVGSLTTSIHPHRSIHLSRILKTSKDGKTKSFDENADGFVKSEAICVMFLQKAKDALRSYAEVVYAQNHYLSVLVGERGPQYGYCRDPEAVTRHLEATYKNAGVSPNQVEYVEACGSADPEADKVELQAIENVFCKDRTDPLFVGSIKSNIGYCETASGLCGIVKLLLAYENGVIPSNLYCENPRQDIAALREGRMRIVTENQPFGRSYAALCDISLSGINAHVLLKGCYKAKDPNRYKSNIPRLVTVSGRQEAAATYIIDDLKSRPIDPEEIALLHNIHEKKNHAHLGRGFVILDTDENNETVCLAESVQYFDDATRPLWFVYSGMGSQWTGMGKELLRIPVFAAAIERCNKVLLPKGLDIFYILTADDKTIYDDILNSFVGITAVQIGLTDVLREMGIVPDNVIGHSVGELGCAYGDGCFTAEEAVLASYSRGVVSKQTKLIRGSMAAIGLGYEQVVTMCPPEIEVACHNGPQSSTISGPAEAMKEFVQKLTAQGIFAKEVPCSNIAYHSRYIADAGPKLLEYLTKVIPTPKRRSKRWVSTSVPQERWDEPQAQHSSAWYHTNNLLSPVLFEETSRLIPSNAVLIEVAPHGLLQAILKRSLPPDCSNIPLTKREHPDCISFLLQSIGKLYMEGYEPKLRTLYPKVEFPVSSGTPKLSHLIQWNHGEKWTLPLCLPVDKKHASIYKLRMSIHDSKYSYLKGHVVRGKATVPVAAILMAVWDTFAMVRGYDIKNVSLQFRDVHLFVQPILYEKQCTEIQVTINKGTGQFEVINDQSKIAVGFIDDLDKQEWTVFKEPNEQAIMNLHSNEIYELLKEREYSYSGDFCSIHKANYTFDEAQLIWNDNWVTLIDGLLQLNALKRNHDAVSQPSHIHKLSIDYKRHFDNKINLIDNKSVIRTVQSLASNYTRCGGILLEKVQFYDFPSVHTDLMELKALEFVPRNLSNCKNLAVSYQVFLQIVTENVNKDVIKIVEVIDTAADKLNIKNIVHGTPGAKYIYEYLDVNDTEDIDKLLEADVVLLKNLTSNKNISKVLERTLSSGVFVINRENNFENTRSKKASNLYEIVSEHKTSKVKLELGIWQPAQNIRSVSSAVVRTEADLENVKKLRAKTPSGHKIIVLAFHPPVQGLRSLLNQWRKESRSNDFSLLTTYSEKDLDHISLNSLNVNLAFNSIKDGVLGGEHYIPWQENVAIEREVTLHSRKIGDLSSLYWTEESNSSDVGISVTVRYAGLNNFDANVATGMIPVTQEYLDSNSYGMDYSGMINTGDRMMGLVRGGATRGRIVAVPELMWPVPINWTLEDAATVPLAYVQAFYCFGIKAQLHPGMTVLVHSGTGALGQAVISVALAYQCKVYTTVSSDRKKKVLLELFPELKADNIGYSRDHSFRDVVLQSTNGRGCDIVVSGLTGNLANATLDCASFCGITFDTAQVHSKNTYAYGMHYLTKQRSYMHVDIAAIFEDKEIMKKLQLLMSEGIARGYVRPLSRVSFAAQDAARAFRMLAGSRHCGRVLLRMRDTIIPAQPKFTCSPSYCQLVVCEKESQSYMFADNLVKCGARKLVIHLASKPSGLYDYKNELWQKLSVEVKLTSGDLGNLSYVQKLLSDYTLEGIYFISSGDSKDSAIISNFDLVSRKLCRLLNYFAVFSESESIGEQVCLSRAQDKLPSTLVYLPLIEKRTSGAAEEVISKRFALDIIERTLHSTQSILRVHYRQMSKPLMEKIANITGIKIPAFTEDNTSLNELGLDDSYASAICTLLQNEYFVSLSETQVPSLTIKQLKEYENILLEPNFKEAKGLSKFYSDINSDEFLPTTTIYPIATLCKLPNVPDLDLDINSQYLWMIPGLDGSVNQFHILCKTLKLPALVLQTGLDSPKETITEIAQRYVKALTKKSNLKSYNDFYILGHEVGVLIAFEVAAILEKEGRVGTVFCIGGGPEDIILSIKNELKDLQTKEDLENAIIIHMSKFVLNYVPINLETSLKEASSWEEKLIILTQNLVDRTTYSMMYLRILTDMAYTRFKEVLNSSTSSYKLKSRIIILRTSSTINDRPSNMQHLSYQPVLEYKLDVPLLHVLKHPSSAVIINNHLSDNLIQKYESQNKCELFVTNADLFLQPSRIIESN